MNQPTPPVRPLVIPCRRPGSTAQPRKQGMIAIVDVVLKYGLLFGIGAATATAIGVVFTLDQTAQGL
jgi:hypothetical protein